MLADFIKKIRNFYEPFIKDENFLYELLFNLAKKSHFCKCILYNFFCKTPTNPQNQYLELYKHKEILNNFVSNLMDEEEFYKQRNNLKDSITNQKKSITKGQREILQQQPTTEIQAYIKQNSLDKEVITRITFLIDNEPLLLSHTVEKEKLKKFIKNARSCFQELVDSETDLSYYKEENVNNTL